MAGQFASGSYVYKRLNPRPPLIHARKASTANLLELRNRRYTSEVEFEGS